MTVFAKGVQRIRSTVIKRVVVQFRAHLSSGPGYCVVFSGRDGSRDDGDPELQSGSTVVAMASPIPSSTSQTPMNARLECNELIYPSLVLFSV